MKSVLTATLILLLGGTLYSQTFPAVVMRGLLSQNCSQAAYKEVYLESRIGSFKDHSVTIFCTREAYTEALKQLGVEFKNAPYAISNLGKKFTYFNSEALLVTNGDRRYRGDFIVAHELGHFATGSANEETADRWALQELPIRVPISYEDFRALQQRAKR